MKKVRKRIGLRTHYVFDILPYISCLVKRFIVEIVYIFEEKFVK